MSWVIHNFFLKIKIYKLFNIIKNFEAESIIPFLCENNYKFLNHNSILYPLFFMFSLIIFLLSFYQDIKLFNIISKNLFTFFYFICFLFVVSLFCYINSIFFIQYILPSYSLFFITLLMLVYSCIIIIHDCKANWFFRNIYLKNNINNISLLKKDWEYETKLFKNIILFFNKYKKNDDKRNIYFTLLSNSEINYKTNKIDNFVDSSIINSIIYTFKYFFNKLFSNNNLSITSTKSKILFTLDFNEVNKYLKTFNDLFEGNISFHNKYNSLHNEDIVISPIIKSNNLILDKLIYVKFKDTDNNLFDKCRSEDDSILTNNFNINDQHINYNKNIIGFNIKYKDNGIIIKISKAIIRKFSMDEFNHLTDNLTKNINKKDKNVINSFDEKSIVKDYYINSKNSSLIICKANDDSKNIIEIIKNIFSIKFNFDNKDDVLLLHDDEKLDTSKSILIITPILFSFTFNIYNENTESNNYFYLNNGKTRIEKIFKIIILTFFIIFLIFGFKNNLKFFSNIISKFNINTFIKKLINNVKFKFILFIFLIIINSFIINKFNRLSKNKYQLLFKLIKRKNTNCIIDQEENKEINFNNNYYIMRYLFIPLCLKIFTIENCILFFIGILIYLFRLFCFIKKNYNIINII